MVTVPVFALALVVYLTARPHGLAESAVAGEWLWLGVWRQHGVRLDQVQPT